MYGFNSYPQNYPQNYQNNYGNMLQGNANIPQSNSNIPQGNPQQDERIWVPNRQAAESYLVAANGFIRLWNSNENVFYERSADSAGRPMQMKTFEYKEVSGVKEPQPTEFVSKDEFADFKNQVNEFIKSLESKEVKKNAKQSNTANADA